MSPAKRPLLFGFVGLHLILAIPSHSQDAPEVVDGIRIFEPAYFNEYDPTSALQLVFRTPGFNPQESNGGRGLSGVRSNILIDGVRPPPKGQSIRQQLREMPVNGVQYIELIDAGARLDIDMQGYPQVVNVVTVEDAPAYYEVETQLQRTGDGSIDQQNERETEVQATGSFSWRDHDFTLSGGMRDRNDKAPSDFVAIDPANPVQRISTLNTTDQKNYGLEFGGDLSLPGEGSLFLTSRVNHWQAEAMPLLLDDGSNPIDSISESFASENDSLDVSAEYRRPFGGSGEILAALVDTQEEQQSESSLSETGLVRSSLNDRESGETAARILITQSPNQNITVRTTATTAFNYFEGGFRIFENGQEVVIQGSSNRVEEDRHSLEGAIDWNMTEQWTLSSAVGAESYEITSSDAVSKQTDPTGLLSISFRPQPRTTFKIESQRRIGQLSFNQFLASSNLSSEIITAGAVELEPERSWNHSASYDRRFGDRGVLLISLVRDEVDNPVRTIALSDELTVAQNTSAQVWEGVNASVEFPFERFGRDDLVLNFDGMLMDSETIDPVTGEKRKVSGSTESFWAIGLRRDPGDTRLAWGMNIQDRTDGDNYSVRRIRSRMSDREWEAYVEYEPIDDFKVRLGVQGPRTDISRSVFFGSVRAPGLDPSFFADTVTRVDRSASLRLDWRRFRNFEIRLSLSSRPRIVTEESLTAFGATEGTLLTTTIADAPRAFLRFRYFNQ